MDDKVNELSDTVNVTMHTLTFSDKPISYAKVTRNTAFIGNIVSKILEHNKVLDRETLLYSAGLFRNAILELLKTGKAVDLLEMGILYIKPDGSMDSESPDISDVPQMSLAFTPSELALESVKNVTVAADITEINEPEISEIFDMSTRTSGTAVTKGHSVRLKGKRLKIAGEEEGTGIFLANCDAEGNYDKDISKWNHINTSELIDNTASNLLFNIPNELESGKYRLFVKTAYGSGTRINKTVRSGLFPKVITVA